MAHILVVYGTTEGHTRKIAERVQSRIEQLGHDATVVDSGYVPPDLELSNFDAFIAMGSLHQGKHQKALVHFVRDNVGRLPKTSAFISSSLTAVIDDDKHFTDAKRCIDGLYSETGWTPTVETPIAGALLYTKYDWLKRMIMKKISSSEGGDTDTSKDYEYTDWSKLDKFVNTFVMEHIVARQTAVKT